MAAILCSGNRQKCNLSSPQIVSPSCCRLSKHIHSFSRYPQHRAQTHTRARRAAVSPWAFSALARAPQRSKCWHTPRCPAMAARCRGVEPPTSSDVVLAPSARSASVWKWCQMAVALCTCCFAGLQGGRVSLMEGTPLGHLPLSPSPDPHPSSLLSLSHSLFINPPHKHCTNTALKQACAHKQRDERARARTHTHTHTHSRTNEPNSARDTHRRYQQRGDGLECRLDAVGFGENAKARLLLRRPPLTGVLLLPVWANVRVRASVCVCVGGAHGSNVTQDIIQIGTRVIIQGRT